MGLSKADKDFIWAMEYLRGSNEDRIMLDNRSPSRRVRSMEIIKTLPFETWLDLINRGQVDFDRMPNECYTMELELAIKLS
jgi:hypothetical protein